MSTLRTKAIVLRRTNYGEADRIVQLLTPERGKVSVIARGVRREKSRLAGGIELFARCDVTVAAGKGELGILTSARLEVFYRHILQDFERLDFGYQAIKQVAKATDHLDEPAFFDLLDQTFASLNDPEVPLPLIKTWFWLQLAILLGVGLNLATDNNGMKLVEDAQYNFDGEHAVLSFQPGGRFTSQHIKLLRLLSAQPPKVAAGVRGVDELIDECLWLAERAVAH